LSVSHSSGWSAQVSEACLDSLEHHVADHAALMPERRPRARRDLAVMRIDDEGNSDDLAVQQVISKPSEHHRRFERMTTTLPSWTRPILRPVWRASSMPFCFMMRTRACG